MKAKKPFWELSRVKALAAANRLILSRSRALNFFEADEIAVAMAKQVLAALVVGQFAETLLQPAKCDVYGVLLSGKGWYLKFTIERGPPEELLVISLHPLERSLKTNTGVVKP